eukprot:TRINITY_DN6729_c0_g1_i1.p1 TRINITY_DN6729_c0_g1~~TRINITY_DN6729_c0_g1_i1.p1  ORF type:complete len:786 (+),score=180.68 TRINITY_DN6729_c0_g1_i1:77-2434(+)
MKKFKELGAKALDAGKRGAEAARDTMASARQTVTEAYLKSKTTLDLEDEITPELRQFMDQFYETKLIYGRLSKACERHQRGKYFPLTIEISGILLDIGLTAPPFATSYCHSQDALKKLYIECAGKVESRFVGHVRSFITEQLVPADELTKQFKNSYSEYNIHRMKIDDMKKKQVPESDPKYGITIQQQEQSYSKVQSLKSELVMKLKIVHQLRNQNLHQHLSDLLKAQARYFDESAALMKSLICTEPIMQQPENVESRTSLKLMQNDFTWPSQQGPSSPSNVRKSMTMAGATIFVGTWNVGLVMPPGDLRSWLNPLGDHDIYVIGVQECEFKVGRGDQNAGDIFSLFAKNTLGSNYVLIHQASILDNPTNTRPSKSVWEEDSDGLMSVASKITPSGSQIMANIVSGGTRAIPNLTGVAGIRLLIFCKAEHEPWIRDVQTSREVTGAGGLNFNKGAIGTSLQFYDTKLCFVCCHLTPHAEKVEQRNADIQDIIKEMTFGNPYVSFTSQFHHVFLFGDYNYRIDMDRDQAIMYAEGKKIAELLEFDQLLRHKKRGAILTEFQEGDITFLPTYKFEKGTLNYDRTKMRTPSYCDRVLWRSMKDRDITLVEYTSDPEIRTSDHIPVSAVFKMSYVNLPPLNMMDARYMTVLLEDINIDYPGMDELAALYIALHTCKSSSVTHHHRVQSPKFHPVISASLSLPEVYRNPYLFISLHDTSNSEHQLGDAVIYLASLIGPIIAACDYPTTPYFCRDGEMITAEKKVRREVSTKIMHGGIEVGSITLTVEAKC